MLRKGNQVETEIAIKTVSFQFTRDWLRAVKPIAEGKTGTNLSAMAHLLERAAYRENIYLIGDVLRILTEWRDEYAEGSAEY